MVNHGNVEPWPTEDSFEHWFDASDEHYGFDELLYGFEYFLSGSATFQNGFDGFRDGKHVKEIILLMKTKNCF